MIYNCPCCNAVVDLKDKTPQQALRFIDDACKRTGHDPYEQMIKFLADNQIDLPVPSCVKVL